MNKFELAERDNLSTRDRNGQEGLINGVLAGMKDGVREIADKPVETGLTVAAGLKVGALIQTGLNNAEHMGGRVGMLAKAAKIGLYAIPAAVSVFRVATADDKGHELGKAAVDSALFIGAGKLGRSADQIPGLGKVFGPRTTGSDMRGAVDYQVLGNRVRIDSFKGAGDVGYHDPIQIRLANGKGFVATGRGTQDLMDMPLSVDGKALGYFARKTTMMEGDTLVTRGLRGGVKMDTADGAVLSTGGGKTFVRTRGEDSVTFNADGSAGTMQGSYRSGRDWDLHTDGSITMRSLPAGKYRLHIAPDGNATETVARGTSRSIMGMVASSRYKPLELTKYSHTRVDDMVGHYRIPDFTQPALSDKNILRSALESLGKVYN